MIEPAPALDALIAALNPTVPAAEAAERIVAYRAEVLTTAAGRQEPPSHGRRKPVRGGLHRMTAQTIADLRRELEKARIALIGAQTYLAHQADANAALHCAPVTLPSPLHAQVTAAIGQVEHALERTEPALIAAASAPATSGPDFAAWVPLGRILLDLDRCQHGRHPADPCGDCGGMSKGNPRLRPGTVIGYAVHGDPIVMPLTVEDKHDPRSWRGALAEAGEQR